MTKFPWGIACSALVLAEENCDGGMTIKPYGRTDSIPGLTDNSFRGKTGISKLEKQFALSGAVIIFLVFMLHLERRLCPEKDVTLNSDEELQVFRASINQVNQLRVASPIPLGSPGIISIRNLCDFATPIL